MGRESVRDEIFAKLYSHQNKFGSIKEDELLRLFMGQIYAESSFNENAISPVGALGLAQFMPNTWGEWGEGDPFNPRDAINAQLKYMAYLFSCYSEIPNDIERFKFALGAYNAGRGSINKALSLARASEGLSSSYSEWKKLGAKEGKWQTWNYTKDFLSEVTGKHSKETLGYVEKIIKYKL